MDFKTLILMCFCALLSPNPIIENGKVTCFSKFLINERKPATYFIVGERDREGLREKKRAEMNFKSNCGEEEQLLEAVLLKMKLAHRFW